MGLNWNLSSVKNFKQVCYEVFVGSHEEMQKRVDAMPFFGPSWQWTDDTQTAVTRMHPTTFTLVFASISVGMGEITQKNVNEYYRRLSIYEKTNGALRNAHHADGTVVPFPYSRDEVEAHIGLNTNVSPMTTRSFNSRIRKMGGEV
jgi:hypothetical protein